MATIPDPVDSTLSRIWAAWELEQDDKPRGYVGASNIGTECERAIWYSFRWAKKVKHSGRTLKIFDRGQREEARFVGDLVSIDVKVMEVDPETGKQFEFSDLGGHFQCHIDGAAVGFVEAPETWHVLEFKTTNEKGFTVLQKEGLQKGNPRHWAQCMVGMGMSGMTRCMYMAVNKNDDDIFIERVRFDQKEYDDIINKAKGIIGSSMPPEKINESPAFYKCKMCDYQNICHEMGELSDKNCRTCSHSEPLEKGGWFCGKHFAELDKPTQRAGCADHLYRAGMIPSIVGKTLDLFGGKIVKGVL